MRWRHYLWIALLLVIAPSARAQVAVVGNLKDLGLNNATAPTTYVLFTLQNYGANTPRITGTNTVVQPVAPPFYPDSSGNISGNIQPNDTISPANTFYSVCVYYQSSLSFPCQNYIINSSPSTFNLNTATPLGAVTPPSPLPTEPANTVLAGPTGGPAAIPSWRPLVGGDLPFPGLSSLGGVFSIDCSTLPGHVQKINTNGSITCSPDSGSGGGSPTAPIGSMQFNAGGGLFGGATGITTPASGPESGNSLHVEGPAPFWRDVVAFGAQSHTMGGTTGTIAATSHTLTVAAALDFNKANGIFVADAGALVTLTAPTITNVNCFGPSETSFGTCGSTTYTYAVSRIDALGGYSAATTATAFTTGPNTLNADNYNMGFGGTLGATTTEGIYVWKKVGAGSYSCLGQFIEPFQADYDYFYFEDWGQASNCPPWIPSSPPVAAGHDPLISTITNIAGTTSTLADAATASVTSDNVFPDDSAAVKAAMTAANNDSPGGGKGPCVLFPSNGTFYFSNLNFFDLFGTTANSLLCVRQSGIVVTYNMPLIIDAGNTDWGGMATNYPVFKSLYGQAAIEALSPGSYENVHDLSIRSAEGTGLIESSGNFHHWNLSVTENSDYAPVLIVGSGSVIFGEIDHSNFSAFNADGAPASILFDCPLGGTTNTINIHDNDYLFHTYKLQSENNGVANGFGACSLHTILDYNNEVENNRDHGWYNIDAGDAAVNYGITLAQNNSATSLSDNDPDTSYPALEYDVQSASGDTGITNMFISAGLWVGPLYSNDKILAGTQIGPCGHLSGWTIVGANGGPYRGSSMNCGGGGWTILPSGNNAGGVETDGTFNSFQAEYSANAPLSPSLVQTAISPTWISLTTSGAGGSLAANTYYYILRGCMTASNTENCTNPSYELKVTTSGSTSSNALSFYNEGYAYTSRFDHCQVWRGTTQSDGIHFFENSYQAIACTGVGPTSFTDTGAAGTSGTPQVLNTAWYSALNSADATPSWLDAGTYHTGLYVGGVPGAALSSGAELEAGGGTIAADLGVDLLDTTTPSGTSSLTRFWSASVPHWPHFNPNNGNDEAVAGLFGTLTPGDCLTVNTSAGELIDSGGPCGGGGGGSGTVTSVAQSFTGGLISVGGSPITTSGTLALTVAGTSGGVPYFSGATTWASSAALTANLPVIGGGAGSAPTVGTVSGNTTEFGTVSGSLTSGHCIKADASANLIDATAACGTATSVGGSFTGGLISVAGSPVTSSGTLALTVAGTSGGVPYFSGASTWASSAALTANLPMIGGGAGNPPAVGTRSGNTTDFATTTGALVNGDCISVDANGNLVDSGVPSCAGFPNAFNTIVSGTNSQAAMVVDTGASLAATGTGTIAATSSPFAGLTAGTNSTSAMVVGTGASLGVSGSGTINSTSINGTSVPVNSSADQFIGTTGSATGAWATMPSCLDSGGNHINYNQSTHAFSCGTSGGTAGSAAFNTITSGTNASAAMVVGTGSSLGVSGSGTISATDAPFSGLSSATNSTATMHVGTGATLDTSGSGVLNANEITGTTVPTNSAADQTVVTTASATGSWASLPSCLDSGGNHINYNTSTHAFSCGTSGGTAGSAAFNTITNGTNSQAAMVVGTGASLAVSGSGTIAATSAPFSGLTGSTNTTGSLVLGSGSSLTISGTGTNNATAINGTTVPTNSAADQAIVTTASATGAWKALPSCLDTIGQHLNYNTSTHSFSCGTTSASSGVTSVGLAAPTGFTVTGSPVVTSGTLTFAMPSGWATGSLLLGNGSNSAASLLIGANNTVLRSNGTTASWSAAGTGTVTSVAFANITTASQNLVTCSTATASTTPSTTCTLANSPAHKFFGNNTAGSAAPDYETIGEGDLPATTVFTDQNATFGAHTYSFAGSTDFKARVSAGLSTAANGEFGFDSTSNNWLFWNGANDVMAPLASGFVSGHCGQPTSTASKWVIADTGAACGAGSGFTPQTNGVTNATTTGINFVNTSGGSGISFTNPGTTTESATLTNTAGGGNSALLCTITGGAQGQYFVLNASNVCVNQTPAVTENNLTCNGYTILQSDLGKTLYCNDAGAAAVTLNSPASYTTGFYFEVKADGAGTVTITASGNIEGAGTMAITTKNHALVTNNGSTYHAMTSVGF